MDEALVTLLLASPAVTELIGEGAASRLYWDVIAQGKASPAVVLYKISGIPDHSHRGPSGLVQSRVQVDCRDRTRAGALAVARAIESLLDGYAGIVGTVRFGSILKDGERSSFDRTEAEAFYVMSADYMIWSGTAG
jgi:hypothetical protein